MGYIPGGYGWLFPKGDHANVGVGGWDSQGPHLRDHLREVCVRHGIAWESLTELRGHRLPMRGAGTQVARGRALAVGDAAGLVDPLSGDGMYEAFTSAHVAVACTRDVLDGRATDLAAYPGAPRQRARAPHLAGLDRQGRDRARARRRAARRALARDPQEVPDAHGDEPRPAHAHRPAPAWRRAERVARRLLGPEAAAS